ncbi:unnamed protein product [Cylicocyclus nassatus]|uniref:Uncharacterized protein n=1 Tax=Cylicocyclus nassatus TaxID=53992 RepID=A0AA36HFE6_CYLNA|nr:unnamed protein product [Cylicocyclus nassatus]
MHRFNLLQCFLFWTINLDQRSRLCIPSRVLLQPRHQRIILNEKITLICRSRRCFGDYQSCSRLLRSDNQSVHWKMSSEIKIVLMLSVVCFIGVEACVGPHCSMVLPMGVPGPTLPVAFVKQPWNVQTWATFWKKQPVVQKWKYKLVGQPAWGPKLVYPVFTGPRAPGMFW